MVSFLFCTLMLFNVYAQYSCTLEFDGASKGNPGQAGAGAVLRAEDGSVVYCCYGYMLGF